MALTPLHATVGMALIKIIPNPFLSLPIAFFSHIIMDLYPEWYPKSSKLKSMWDFKNYSWKEWTFLVIQGLLSLWIIYFLIRHNVMYSLGAIFANLMDIWDFIYYKIYKRKFWFIHGGWFPFRRTFPWQGFGMNPLQNAFLDLTFITIILSLLIK